MSEYARSVGKGIIPVWRSTCLSVPRAATAAPSGSRREARRSGLACATAEDVAVHGATANWKDSTVARHFCPSCGSPLFGVSDGTGEIAIGLGAFDAAPTDLVPTYELWVGRREKWVKVVTGAEQFPGNRTAVA